MLPSFRSLSFDGCICIAVIHHLSTEQRRLDAIKELVRITRVGGLILVYVWALEQDMDETEASSDKEINDESRLKLDKEVTNINDNIKNGEGNMQQEDKQFIQVCEGRNTFQQQDLLVPWHLKNADKRSSNSEQVFHRFYHVFKQGELKELCCNIANIRVKDLYLDCGNWCIIMEKIKS